MWLNFWLRDSPSSKIFVYLMDLQSTEMCHSLKIINIANNGLCFRLKPEFIFAFRCIQIMNSNRTKIVLKPGLSNIKLSRPAPFDLETKVELNTWFCLEMIM